MARRRTRNPAEHTQVPKRVGVSPWLAALVLVGLVLFAYWPALHGGFIWDDKVLLSENGMIRAADGLYRFWFTTEAHDYWPLTSTTFWLEWRLWGADSTGYHVTNMALHALEALLLWVILRRLQIPGAYLGALLFAVHPVNVESVAWIAQRKNLVALLFLELAVLAYLKSDASPEGRSARAWYAASLAAFVLAMLGKGSAAVLPLLLPLIVWWQRDRLVRRDVLRIAPFFPIAAGLVLVNIWFQTHGTGPIRDTSWPERLAGSGAVVWFYLSKAILPLELAFVYPQWQINWHSPAWWLPTLAVVGVSALLWRRRAGWGRPYFMAWAFFVTALLPVMGFVDVYFMKYSLVADHYQHLAIAGVLALLAAGLTRWQAAVGKPAQALAVVLVLLCVFRTRQECLNFADEPTVFASSLHANPTCWLCHHNLAVARSAEGRRAEAIDHYQQALNSKPDLTDARVNLALMLVEDGRTPEAIEHLQEAVRRDPLAHQAHYNLGLALGLVSRWEAAVPALEQALRLKPDDPDAHNGLGSALQQVGRTETALVEFESALALRPGFAEAHANLGLALARLGRTQPAVAELEQASQARPEDATLHYNLGILLTDLERFADARAHYERALVLQPGYAEAHNNLATLLLKLGHTPEALTHFERAAAIAPTFFDARLNLIETLARAGRSTEAVAQAQAAAAQAHAVGDAAWARRFEAWERRK